MNFFSNCATKWQATPCNSKTKITPAIDKNFLIFFFKIPFLRNLNSNVYLRNLKGILKKNTKKFLSIPLFSVLWIHFDETEWRTGTQECPVEPEVALLTTVPRRTKLAWQVFTEHHSAHVRQLQDQETYNFLGEAKRWMSFPEDRSIVSNRNC